MASLAPTAGLIGGVSILAYASHWLLGRRIAQADRPTQQFRRLLVLGGASMVGLLGIGFLVTDASLTTPLFDALGGDVDGTWLGSLLWVTVYGAASLVVVLAGFLGLFPHLREARDLDYGYRHFLIDWLRYLGSLWLIILLAQVLLEAVFVGGMAFALVFVTILVVVLHGVSPWLIRLTQPCRRPTEAQQQRLRSLLAQTDLDVTNVWVREVRGAQNPFATVRGLPGRRALFVSDYLLETLDVEQLRVLLTSKAGRVRFHYLEYKLAVVVVIVAVMVLPLALAPDIAAWVDVPAWQLQSGLWLGGAVILAGVYRRAWTRTYRVDDYVASRVGAATYVATIERLAELADLRTDSESLASYLVLRPPLARRLDRLRPDDRAESDDLDETTATRPAEEAGSTASDRTAQVPSTSWRAPSGWWIGVAFVAVPAGVLTAASYLGPTVISVLDVPRLEADVWLLPLLPFLVVFVILGLLFPLFVGLDARAITNSAHAWEPNPWLWTGGTILALVVLPVVRSGGLLACFLVGGYYLFQRHAHVGVP